jgi:hypothetical protein
MINSKRKIHDSTAPEFESSLSKSSDYSVPHRLGRCDQSCDSCGALHWNDKATIIDQIKKKKSYSTCCQKNKVHLPDFDEGAPRYPSKMREMLTGKDEGEHSLDFN